jgi:hypothetical protein
MLLFWSNERLKLRTCVLQVDAYAIVHSQVMIVQRPYVQNVTNISFRRFLRRNHTRDQQCDCKFELEPKCIIQSFLIPESSKPGEQDKHLIYTFFRCLCNRSAYKFHDSTWFIKRNGLLCCSAVFCIPEEFIQWTKCNDRVWMTLTLEEYCLLWDRSVVRVPGYRSRVPGSIPGATRFSEK